MDLNEEQIKAATHPPGEAALLLAGAGSGKTSTLTERISWLIEQGTPARRILALTFTNKAAAEIRERVLKRTGLTEDAAPRLTTIHSLALSMIRRNPAGFGMGTKVTPLAEYDQNGMLKKLIEREEFEDDIKFPKLRDQISFHRARGVGFYTDYTEEVHKRAVREHSGFHALGDKELKIWKLYEEEKQKSDLVDFDDMIWLVNRRMTNDPEWLVKVQALFDHVIVDEAQDTNVPQFTFINYLLGPNNRNLYLTGDLSQSIYGFSGASPALIKEFSDRWRGGTPILYRLVRNHRSVPEVVNLANAIQEKMTESLPLQMTSFRGEQGERGKVRMMRDETPRRIAYTVADTIANGEPNYRDYAILVRSAIQVRDIEAELIRQRIPYVVRGGTSLMQTEEARDVLSYLRFATNPKDFTALSRCIAAPRRGIGDSALESIRKIALAEFSSDLLKACHKMGGKFSGFATNIEMIQSKIDSPSEAMTMAVGVSKYLDHIKKKYAKDPDKVQMKIDNLVRMKEMIADLASDVEITTEDLIFHLTMEKVDKPDNGGMVTITTIHSAKGLEWKRVYVWSVVESQLPHKFSMGSNSEIEEERRLFYVACTRARDQLTICVPEKVQLGERYSEVEQSRFLDELS